VNANPIAASAGAANQYGHRERQKWRPL
jgi:hypothetical protein